MYTLIGTFFVLIIRRNMYLPSILLRCVNRRLFILDCFVCFSCYVYIFDLIYLRFQSPQMLSERFLQNSGTDEYDPDVPPTVGPQRLQYSLTSPEQRREDQKNPLPNALHSSHGSPREMEVIGGRPYEAEAKPPSAAEQRFEKLRSKLDAVGSREGKARPSEPFATPSGSNEPSPSAPNQKLLNPSKSESINVVEANPNVVAPTTAQKQMINAGNPLQPTKSLSSTGNTVRRVPLMYDKVYIEDSKNCAFEVQIMERWKISPPRLEKNAPFLMSHPPVLLDPSISKDVNNGFERPVKVPPRREGSPQLLEPTPQPQYADDDEKKVGLLDRFRLAVQRMQVKSELCSTSNRFRFFFPELASPAASINKNQRPASSTNPSQDFWLGEFQCVSIHNNRPHEGHVIVTDKHVCFLGHLRRETFVVRSISPLSSIICIEECTTETDKTRKTAAETPHNRNVVKDSDIHTKGKIFHPIQQRGDSVLPDALQIYFDNGTVLQLFDIKNKLFKRIPTQRPSLVDGKSISTEEPSKQQEFYFGSLSGEIGMHQTFLRDATDLDRFEGLLEHAWRSQIGM